MSDAIDRTLIHGFNKLGLFKFDAAMQRVLNGIPVLGSVFNAIDRTLEGWGINNRAQLEAYNRANPHDQVENPYADSAAGGVPDDAGSDNETKTVVVMEATRFPWQKTASQYVSAPAPERNVA